MTNGDKTGVKTLPQQPDDVAVNIGLLHIHTEGLFHIQSFCWGFSMYFIRKIPNHQFKSLNSLFKIWY